MLYCRYNADLNIYIASSYVKSNEEYRTTVLEPDINAEDKSGDTHENLEDIRYIFNACVCKGGSTIFFNPQRGGSTIFFD